MSNTNKELNNVQLNVTFVPASIRENIVSGENISTSFGKLSKLFSDLKSIAWDGHPTVTQNDTTSSVSPNPEETFTVVDSVSRNNEGHITGINTKTVKLPTGSGYVHPTYDSYSSGLYKVEVDELGHVSGATAVTKSDITNLGIPSSNTLNTAGSTNTSSKIYLIGATSQSYSSTTYSHDTVYVGTDGCLYSNSSKVLTEHPSITISTDSTSTASPTHGGTFTVVDTVTRDTNGHVTKVNTKTVTLPAQYSHPTYTSKSSGLYKITVDTTGHVSATSSVTKSDIPSLDYISSTTTRNTNLILAGPSSGSAAAPTFRALVTADLPTSGATAGSYGPSANASPAHGGTFSVPYITINAKGQVTAASTKTITLPTSSSGSYLPLSGGTLTGDLTIGSDESLNNLKVFGDITTESTLYAYTISVGGNKNCGSSTEPIYLSNGTFEPCTLTSLKNPFALTLKGNGTTLSTYDGAGPVTVDITPRAIGAATSSHTHSGYASASHTHSGYASSSHTHPYLPLSGGTMKANAEITMSLSADGRVGKATCSGYRYKVPSSGGFSCGDYWYSDSNFSNMLGGIGAFGNSGSLSYFFVGGKYSNPLLKVDTSGNVVAKGSITGSGADYTEFWEMEDGNLNNEDLRGFFVTVNENNKILKANEGDYILGVISATPVIIGNEYPNEWKNKYLKDVYGNHITVENEVDGVKTTELVINPEYDPDREYVNRSNRKEWQIVGLIGQLIANDDGTSKPGGFCKVKDGGIATSSDSGYRVLERIDDSHIKILFK